MLEVVEAYVMRWRMRFNSRKSKIVVVGKREGGTNRKRKRKVLLGKRWKRSKLVKMVVEK